MRIISLDPIGQEYNSALSPSPSKKKKKKKKVKREKKERSMDPTVVGVVVGGVGW